MELAGQLTEVVKGIAKALDDLRELSRGIHPAILSEGGLVPALKTLARRSAVPVQLDLALGGKGWPSTWRSARITSSRRP